jgi:hypothetical protein
MVSYYIPLLGFIITNGSYYLQSVNVDNHALYLVINWAFVHTSKSVCTLQRNPIHLEIDLYILPNTSFSNLYEHGS